MLWIFPLEWTLCFWICGTLGIRSTTRRRYREGKMENGRGRRSEGRVLGIRRSWGLWMWFFNLTFPPPLALSLIEALPIVVARYEISCTIWNINFVYCIYLFRLVYFMNTCSIQWGVLFIFRCGQLIIFKPNSIQSLQTPYDLISSQ